MSQRNDSYWFTDRRNLAALWSWLVEHGDNPTDAAAFIEKPWKWQPEWDAMQSELRRERVA